MSSWMTVVLATLALLGSGGGIYSALTTGATRRKMLAETEQTKADTVTVLGKAAVDLIQPLRTRIKELEDEVDVLRVRVRKQVLEIDRLEENVAHLQAEITRLQGL